jgi:VWFA-related protein
MTPPRAKRSLALIALLCVSALSYTSAQQNTEPRVFNISVVDEEGKPYTGLKPEDLSVWVDKTQRKITSLTLTESTPASIGILLDLSGSVGPYDKKESNAFRRKLNDGLTHFMAVSNADNDYFVGTFNTRVAFSETWTGPEDSVFEKLGAREEYGTTALYDALYHGIHYAIKGRHSRHVVLIITDGMDNESKRSFKDVANLVKRSDVMIYAVAVYEKPSYGSAYTKEGLEVLDDLTKLSGGRTVFLKSEESAETVNNAFGIIADNLKSQYRLAIENETVAGPEKWRKLKLKLNLPEEKGQPKLDIWSRTGYYQ